MKWDKIIADFLSVRSLITLGAFFTLYSLVWRGLEVPQIVAHIVDILLGFGLEARLPRSKRIPMAKSLIKLCKELLAPKVIVDTLKNQDSRELGSDTGKAIKRFMVNEFGDKGGKELLSAMKPWIDRFYLALRTELDGD